MTLWNCYTARGTWADNAAYGFRVSYRAMPGGSVLLMSHSLGPTASAYRTGRKCGQDHRNSCNAAHNTNAGAFPAESGARYQAASVFTSRPFAPVVNSRRFPAGAGWVPIICSPPGCSMRMHAGFRQIPGPVRAAAHAHPALVCVYGAFVAQLPLRGSKAAAHTHPACRVCAVTSIVNYSSKRPCALNCSASQCEGSHRTAILIMLS